MEYCLTTKTVALPVRRERGTSGLPFARGAGEGVGGEGPQGEGNDYLPLSAEGEMG